MKTNLRFFLIVSSISISMVSGCKDDKEDEITPTTNPQEQQCDTNAVTYSNTVASIINSNCLSCHSAAIATGGIILDSHARLKQVADNGKLMGVITHAAGFKPMPQGGAKLSDCNIAKIKRWVDAGTPNN